MKILTSIVIAWVVLMQLSVSVQAEEQRFPDVGYTPPSDWTGPMFVLSQDYPPTLPAEPTLPWATINFREEPERYLWAIIDYSFDGNDTVDFVVQQNKKRKWYHAPWLHYGNNGREFVRGLTRERSSRPFELAPTQKTSARNYAIGFYNDLGGYTIGQVWIDAKAPKPDLAKFPEGTATFKLLFTTANIDSVPWLEGSPEWVADIDRAESAGDIMKTKVRLLQIDIAVKDKRSLKGGWVFGTFHFDSSVANSNPWRRLRALSLMWGDDQTVMPGDEIKESWINKASPVVTYRENPPAGINAPSTLGWGGRANGPVDNPVSSCLSCHGTAQLPARADMVPSANLTNNQRMDWFRNLVPLEPFTAGSVSLDYSLQLGIGIQNLRIFKDAQNNLAGFSTLKLMSKAKQIEKEKEFIFTRDPGDR